MKLILIALLCLFCVNGHIYASDSKVTYDFDGNPLIYHIFFSLETGLGSDDYVKIIWPFTFHASTDKTLITAKLISFSNNLEIVQSNFDASPADSNPTYYISFGVSLTAKKWYEIQITPNQDPTETLPYHGLIQMDVVSSTNNDAIIYDSNKAFGFISVQAALGSTGSLAVAASSTSTQRNRVSSIYAINIDVTPTIDNSNGGNFTLSIHYDDQDGDHASGTGLLDFTFMGLCQSVDPGSGTAAVLNYCQISDDLTKIYFSVATVTAGTTIRISTQISNPLFISQRGIRAYFVDFISGVVIQNGYDQDALSVTSIAIDDLGSQRIYLLWGLDSDFIGTDSQLSGLSLGLFKASGTNVGPFNSFNIGFSFSQTSPIEGRYRVKMTLQADGFLQGSIAHNLPAYSDLKVYCHYNTADKQILCENVGAFINTNYRYFISGKAYFGSGTASSLSTFGDVQIVPIVYDDSGSQLPVTLYDKLQPGDDQIAVQISQQYLDTSGYHSDASRKIGVAQIVSFQDDGTLSSTANAMKNFMTGTNSTIGVVPDLGVSQQLLLLLKVASISSSGTGDAYYMRLLYNPKVIGFQTDAEQRGLDFVGYDNTNSQWSIQYSRCHVDTHVVCQKYNYDTPSKNTQIRVNQQDSTNFYGLYKFDCGSAYSGSYSCDSDCATACNMFTGYSTADYGSSIMSMRKVTFPSTQYHSSLYADDSLLDFVVVFKRGTTVVGWSLINAYTMVGAPMENIKASYVNYYEDTSGNFNKGSRIPTMIRIAGGVLPKQSRNATVIGVFFDDNVDAHTFYTHKDQAYDIGCSTANCLYYPNTGISLHANDIWHTMRRVQFYDIPPIQNQFDMLVPVTPSISRYSADPMPDTLTIAFFTQNHSIGDATNLLKTVSVYRLFGTAVQQSITGSIGSINGMDKHTSAYFDSYLASTTSDTLASSFYYTLNTSNILENPPNNTFRYGYGGSFNFNNNQYGCGVTLTSLYYNIFQSSTLAFETLPANTAQTCTIFGYIYNEQTGGSNPERDGQWMYVAFCPIDSNITLNNVNGNIHIYNPQYPNVFTQGFQLRSVLTYGISEPAGGLVAYRHQTGSVSAFQRTCTTAKLLPYNPSSAGKQRATFTISTPQIRMSSSGYDGYPHFRVYMVMPSGISGITMRNQCQVSDPDLSCSASSGSTTQVIVTLTYTGTGVITITYFQLELYAVTTGSLGSQSDYTITIYLPQYISTYVPFGSAYNSNTQYASCTSAFKIGTTAYQTSMNYQLPTLLSTMKQVKTPIQFNFGSYSYRETFFASSYYQFHFGFLQNLVTTARSANNFRCAIYQNNNGALTLSSKWEYINFGSFPTVRLYPKYAIDDPAEYLFTMKCTGSGVPTGPDNDMTLIWKDYSFGSTNDIQTATPLAMPSTYTTAPSGTLTVSLQEKRFISAGMKAFYTFQVNTNTAIDQNTRIYFNFHLNLNSRLDKQGAVQCYIRQAAGTADADAVFTYCQFNYDRQLVIWNNLDVGSGIPFYIDIFNIQQPKSTDTTPVLITVSIDKNTTYNDGVYAMDTLNDVASSGSPITNFHILQTQINTTYIRSPQTIKINIDTITNALFTSGFNLYLVLSSAYGQWISRGQTLDHSTDQCYLQDDGTPGVNLLSACTFISKRILKMTLGSGTTLNKLTLIINNLYSPSKLPSGRYNQYRFKLFSADGSQSSLTYYTFTDYSHTLTLQPDSTLLDLSWKYHTIGINNQLVSLTDASQQTFLIYIGYYSNAIELRQSIYPSNYQVQMQLELNSHPAYDFPSKDGLIVELGTKNAYLRLAANTSVQAGLKTLQYNKIGDHNGQYTAIPPLTVVVSSQKCSLVTEESSYTLPLGGYTLPIKISAISCIPLNDIQIELTYDNVEVSTNVDLSSSVLNTTNTNDGQLYFVVQHTSGTTLAIGDTVTITFTITGTQAEFYQIIPSITLTVVDPVTYQTLPTATALSTPSLDANKATFTLQCSMSSKIYWGIGIYPSILNSVALDFQARIISGSTGLLTNFTEPQDQYMRVYGINYVATTQTLTKIVYNLKSNQEYIFKYYCINQMGIISDGQSLTFTSQNYGAYLMKVSITFQGSITYGQYNNLACSLAQNFKIPYNRIMTQAMSSCQESSTIFYSSTDSVIQNAANSDNQYVYNFYILPDYNISSDTTNSDIRTALALSSTSTTIITTTTDFINLPELVQMQTEDIQFFTTPTLSISDPISGLNSIVVTASITNMNGFIIIGCMDGVFNTSTMTLPSSINIKKGLLEENSPLLAVKMLYAIQNFNITISFTGLADNKEYSFFYFATQEDPTLVATGTTVKRFNAKTLEALTVNINWESLSSVQIVMALCIVLFLFLS